MIQFFVPGVPAPKGSMRVFSIQGKDGKHRNRATHDNERTLPWSGAVSAAAMVAMQGKERIVNTPLVVQLTFLFPRPSGHYGARGLKPSKAGSRPATKPDLDKLARAALDALEGMVFDNDSRIVELTLRKQYAHDEEGPGMFVSLWEARD